MLETTVGHQVLCTINYLDTKGNPMLVPPATDAPPGWTNAPSDPGDDTMTPAAEGSSALVVTQAPGTDTISAALAVSGTAYNGSLSLVVDAAPQVLGSIEVVGTVQAPGQTKKKR